MKIKKVTAAFFSPGGNVEKIAMTIGETAADILGAEFEIFDFLLPDAREKGRSFGADELLVIGLPVFAGRLPNKILHFVQNGFKAGKKARETSMNVPNTSDKGNAICIPFVSFGNRAFDDGLSELVMEMRNSGFTVAGAAAVVGEHSFCGALATGRPDDEDLREVVRFSNQVCEKIIAADGTGIDDISVPGNTPPGPYYTPLRTDGEKAVFLKAKPATDKDKCNGCMDCVRRCPMGTIRAEDPTDVSGICIKCQACVKVCHAGAKYFNDPDFLSHRDYLDQHHREKKDNMFLL